MGAEDLVADACIKGSPVRVTFSGEAISWTGRKNSGSVLLQEDALGFRSDNSSITLFTFQMASPKCTGSRRRVKEEVVFDFNNASDAGEWSNALESCFSAAGRPRRLLVLVNPAGGRGRAKKIFAKQVLPLLSSARVNVTTIETQYHKHALHIAKELDLSTCDGVVCVSGDGLPIEVLNGFLERPDWEQAIRKPIGIIPAGSGNGVAKSLTDAAGEPCDIGSSTFAIICGKTCAVDVATVRQGNTVFHSLLNVYWGLTADVDVESEKYRFMGGARLTFQSIIRIIKLRAYNGSFSYIPALPAGETSIRINDNATDFQDVNLTTKSGNDPDGGAGRSPLTGSSAGYMGPALPSGEWKTVKGGEFVFAWMQNLKWAASDMMSHPKAMMSDGCLDCLILRPMSRLKIISLFLKMDTGNHLSKPYPTIDYFKARAVRFQPGLQVNADAARASYVMADGEVLCRGIDTEGSEDADPMTHGPEMEVGVSQGLATVYSL